MKINRIPTPVPVGVILAAGLGLRLRPSTEHCPKPLIPVGGVEPLFFAIFQAHKAGIERIVVNAFYLPERVKSALNEWQGLFEGLEIRCEVESPEILGTGGGILNILHKNADWFKNGEGLLLQNGDTLAQIDIKRLFRDPNQSTLAISKREDHLKKYNPLWIDENSGLWTGIGKSPPTDTSRPAHFLGVHFIAGRDVATLMADNITFPVRPVDLFNGIYRPLNTKGSQFASIEFFESLSESEFWFDMTTQAFLLEAQRHVLTSLESSAIWGQVLNQRFPEIKEVKKGIWVKTSRNIVPGISLTAPAVFVDLDQGVELVVPPIKIGPHATFIHERGSVKVDSSSGLREVEIINSVVFTGNATTQVLGEQIRDQICVL